MSVPSAPQPETTELSRRERYRRLAEQLRKWASEDPEYDQRVGELLAAELPSDRVRCRDSDFVLYHFPMRSN